MKISRQKLITLNEARKLTPYTADYLGQLIRKRRLEAWKEKGRWHTSREAVERYLQKVAEASYAHQENLNIEVPAEKIKIASIKLKWVLVLTGVIVAGGALFGAWSYVKSEQDSARVRYKVRKDEAGNIAVEVPKDEYVRSVNVVRGE